MISIKSYMNSYLGDKLMIDNPETILGSIEFATSSYYRDWKTYILKILKLSRNKKIFRSPIESLVVQISIAKTLSEIEKTIGIQKKEYGFDKCDPNLIYNIRLRQIFKDIADGIAWRILGFNRPLMRILSQNKSPGYLKYDDSKEDYVGTKIIATGRHVLLHDITNILRIGDITVIDPDGYPNIIEVKKTGKKIWTALDYIEIYKNGGDLTNQAKKLVELNEAIRTGVISVGGNKAILSAVNIPINTCLSNLEKIIYDCLQKGISSAFIDRMIYIRAIKVASVINNLDLPFDSELQYFNFSSIETLIPLNGEIFRNKIPYSCYPFSDDIIMQILSGEIIIECYINLRELNKRIEKLGWRVKNKRKELLNRNDIDIMKNPYGKSSLFETKINTTILVLSHEGFNIEIGVEHMGQIVMDFYKPEYLVDFAKFNRTKTERNRTNGYIAFWNTFEKSIWN